MMMKSGSRHNRSQSPASKDHALLKFFLFLLTLLILALLLGCGRSLRKNVLFIGMDTTRFDYVDIGQGSRSATPQIKRFSRDAQVFMHAFSPVPQTLPAHLSVFTSCLPHELGVYTNEDKYDGRKEMIQETLKMRDYYTAAVISLGTLSSQTGFNRGFDGYYDENSRPHVFYRTAEEVADKAITILNREQRRNFFLFLHFSDPHTPYAPPQANRSYKIFLDGKLESEFNAFQGAILKKKIFLKKGPHTIHFKLDGGMDEFKFFVIRGLSFSESCSWTGQNIRYSGEHYKGSHLVINPEAAITVKCVRDSEVALFQVIPILTESAARQLYKQEVEYMDHHIGRVLEELKRLKLMKRTIIALFADHGEGLGEIDNYFGHTRYVNRQFIHVPFILHVPGRKGRQIDAPVSLTTVTPTVLDALGMLDAGSTDKRKSSLHLTRSFHASSRSLYSFVFADMPVKEKLSVIEWPYQSIFYLVNGQVVRREFYNLFRFNSFHRHDSLEKNFNEPHSTSVYARSFQEYQKLKNVFERSRAKYDRVDMATRERLKALGYIH